MGASTFVGGTVVSARADIGAWSTGAQRSNGRRGGTVVTAVSSRSRVLAGTTLEPLL